MIDCLVAGDSIALAVSAFLHCKRVNAKIGIGSQAIIDRVAPAPVVIISAGSNDPANPLLAVNLSAMRANAGETSKVIWVLPIHPRARETVKAVADEFGDIVVSFKPGCIDPRLRRDCSCHPKSDRQLARDIAKVM